MKTGVNEFDMTGVSGQVAVPKFYCHFIRPFLLPETRSTLYRIAAIFEDGTYPIVCLLQFVDIASVVHRLRFYRLRKEEAQQRAKEESKRAFAELLTEFGLFDLTDQIFDNIDLSVYQPNFAPTEGDPSNFTWDDLIDSEVALL
jgi:hypothetical protein